MQLLGPDILARTLSSPKVTDSHKNSWSYHSRSDNHSKVSCWGIVFDLMRSSGLLRKHVAEGRIGFGINHEIRDFQHDRKKDLDLVICTPASGSKTGRTLADLGNHYGLALLPTEQQELTELPVLHETTVGTVLIALEAKACMTAHQRALPRLYDELNSSHQTVHGAYDAAVVAGLVMVNIASEFLSPDRNKENRVNNPKWSQHDQPKSVEITINKIKQLPRRSKTGQSGYDAIGIMVIDCVNDGRPVSLYTAPPAPQLGDTYHYFTMIDRMRGLYETRFAQI